MKFTLRDIFWLIVVIAVAFGWVVDRNRINSKHKEHLRFQSQLNSALVKAYNDELSNGLKRLRNSSDGDK
jgi:hypothetical protein